MAKEYIEREAAKMAVVEALGKGHSPFNAIVMLSAADVVQVRHGRWESKRTITHDGEWYCNLCEFEPYYERDIHTLSFCPNCGARMDGDGDV